MRRILFLLFLLPALAFSQPTDGKVERPDLTLHYTCVGHGEPLLILSGGPGLEVVYMTDLVKPLSEQNRCILLEQRGTGRSQPAKVTDDTYLVDSYVEDIEALRKSLHLGQFNVLGHSWGGMLAMAYCAKYPARVHSLVLLSSGGMDLQALSVLPQIIAKRLTPDDLKAQEKWASPEQQKLDPDHADTMALVAVLPAYFYDRKLALSVGAEMSKGHLDNKGVIDKVFGGFFATGYDVRVGLTAYHGPAFISQGTYDVIGDDTARLIGETIYGSQVQYIDHCGHFEWLEKPGVLLPPLKSFLKANASHPEASYDELTGEWLPFRFGHHGRR